MRRFLTLLALVLGSLVALSGPASATQCADMGPDLSKFGVQQIQYCGPSPF